MLVFCQATVTPSVSQSFVADITQEVMLLTNLFFALHHIEGT